MNDDLFFIWAGLNKEDSFIVSNDKFKDHIFKISEELIVSNILSKWIKNSVITYKTMEKKNIIHIKLNFPKKLVIVLKRLILIGISQLETINGDYLKLKIKIFFNINYTLNLKYNYGYRRF